MITTINAFRKLNENLYPEGDFIKYNYNDTPDVEEYMNQAAQAMGEMTDSLYWMETQEVEEISGIMKDITGDESYDLDKVEAYSTKQGTVKIYIHSGDTGSYFIICNMNMNGKKIVDDQIVDIYQNDYSEVTPEDSNDPAFNGDDLDPAGGRGLASHESRKIFEGGSDGDFEHNQNQIELASKLYDEGQVLFNQGNIEAAEQKRQEALKVGSWLSWTDTELPPYDLESGEKRQLTNDYTNFDDKNPFSKDNKERRRQEFGESRTNENCSNDPLCLAFQAKNIECSVSPKGEIIVTVSFPLGDTDYWFEPLDTTMTPKSKGIYTCTSASHVNIGEGTDVEPNVFKGDVEQAVQFISHNLAQAKAAFDEIPKTTMTPSEPEKPGPKVVGKIDLKDDGKQRFKHKNETMITKIEDFKNKIIKEGAVKRHWEEILSAIESGTELSYLSGTEIRTSIPTEYYNNVVTFINGVNILDMNVQTSVNPLKINTEE